MSKPLKILQYIATLAAVGACALANAQQVSYTASIEPAKQSGYHNIELSQEVVAVSDAYFSSLRVIDSKGKPVPYMVRSESPVREVSKFVSYQLLENKAKDSLNVVVIENKDAEKLSQLCVVVTNADVEKYATLRGSNDRQQWYMVKQRENISYSVYNSGSEDYLAISFPQTSYKYYELALSNNQSSPLNVVKVGRFENTNLYAQLCPIDLGGFVQKDSTDKKSYIFFPSLSYTYRLCKLEVEAELSGAYLRDAYLASPQGYQSFQLSSKGSNSTYLSLAPISASTPIIITNNDNPPLKVVSVKAYGLGRYLCAYLDKDERYTIAVDASLYPQAPSYDVERVQSEIPQNIETLKLGPLSKHVTEEAVRQLRWYEKPAFLWGVIIVVGALLGYLSLRVISDMKKREEK